MSVLQHCLSPLSEGLFQKAVMSSGGGVSKLMAPSAPEARYDFWNAVMEKAGCQDLAAFRALAPEKLFAAWDACKAEHKGAAMAVSPCLDGRLVVGKGSDILAAGSHRQIPYMAGSTSEDVMPPVIYSMAKAWCAAQQRQSYSWFFDRQLPGDDCGAWHSSDLWYWFGTLPNCWRPLEEKDYALSDQMTDYLTNFCKHGDPNGPGLTTWLPMGKDQRQVLRLGEGNTRMGKVSMLRLVKTLLTNKAVGE